MMLVKIREISDNTVPTTNPFKLYPIEISRDKDIPKMFFLTFSLQVELGDNLELQLFSKFSGIHIISQQLNNGIISASCVSTQNFNDEFIFGEDIFWGKIVQSFNEKIRFIEVSSNGGRIVRGDNRKINLLK